MSFNFLNLARKIVETRFTLDKLLDESQSRHIVYSDDLGSWRLRCSDTAWCFWINGLQWSDIIECCYLTNSNIKLERPCKSWDITVAALSTRAFSWTRDNPILAVPGLCQACSKWILRLSRHKLCRMNVRIKNLVPSNSKTSEGDRAREPFCFTKSSFKLL